MQYLLWPSLGLRSWAASGLCWKCAAARSQRLRQRRRLHTTPRAFQAPNNPPSDSAEAHSVVKEASNQNKTGRYATYGSASRRAARGRKKPDLPPPGIPEWFINDNVVLKEELGYSLRSLEILSQVETSDGEKDQDHSSDPSKVFVNGQWLERKSPPPPDKALPNRYQVLDTVLEEVLAAVQSALYLPRKQYSDSLSFADTQVQFSTPVRYGTRFVQTVSEHLRRLNADVIHLSPLSLATVGANYLAEVSTQLNSRRLMKTSQSLRMLSYNIYKEPSLKQDPEEEEEEEEEASEENEDGDVEQVGKIKRGGDVEATIVPLPSWLGEQNTNLVAIINKARRQAASSQGPTSLSTVLQDQEDGEFDLDDEDERALTHLISTICASREKKLSSSPSKVASTASSFDPAQRGLIISLSGYDELEDDPIGRKVLRLLKRVVWLKRKAGERIALLGISEQPDEEASKFNVSRENNEAEEDDSANHIMISPLNAKIDAGIFKQDEQATKIEVNVRHLAEQVFKRAPQDVGVAFNEGVYYKLFKDHFSETFWSYPRVVKVARTAIGASTEQPITLATVAHAIEVMEASESSKELFDAEQSQDSTPRDTRSRKDGSSASERPEESENDEDDGSQGSSSRQKRNSFEKKFANGVINPEKIDVTFGQVRASDETIETLKDITVLPKLRPEEFQYGTLLHDKIPGLLLYGPPGTGKTLLAKAAAKDAAASVLEVSGADINDMYVGESEKNVKAIFSLAKKLEPCIVFIDEADAIFGSRDSGSNSRGHRDTINQFLREWDGMDSRAAFLMIATNRPFDLDDAVLRRLPRRVLVDLPTEADRQAILRIHLYNESLDPEVSLEDLAHRTPFYSGSDLKNVAVAAAIACVREDTDEAVSKAGDETPTFPARRVLKPRHFDQALSDISASINEDMSSLKAIRKFDEKYGDRKGRRPKQAYGFGSSSSSKVENARVRS